MRSLKELGLFGDNGATASAIAAIESLVGQQLPDGYKELVRTADAATPETGTFEYGNGLESAISEFLPIADPNSPCSLYSYVKRPPDGVPGTAIPFARDAGDNLLCFDFSIQPPAIQYYDHETKDMTRIAPSFEEFIDSLRD